MCAAMIIYCPLFAPGHYLQPRGPVAGPRFMYGDSWPLTQQQLTLRVQSIVHLVRYSGSYSGHSFRICASTTAAACGVPEHLIKTFGRCSSNAYQVDVHKPICSIIHGSNQLV